MEEELMFMIRNDLCELKHNGFEISDIKMYTNLEMDLCVSYKYGGQKFVITSDCVGKEE